MWVKGFLERAEFSRRKITGEAKKIPSEDAVRREMSHGQHIYEKKGYTPLTTANLDELATCPATGPTHIYLPVDAKGANLVDSAAKVRLTTLPVTNGLGYFAPLFFIIKHSKSSEECPDQTTMTVLNKLHKQQGFTVEDGWELKVFESVFTIPKKKKPKKKGKANAATTEPQNEIDPPEEDECGDLYDEGNDEDIRWVTINN
jgi:hypothetical protein